MKLFHGTSTTFAASIIRDGVNPSLCEKGYFGRGFYCAYDFNLARSNYASFSDDEEGGAVLELEVPDSAILSAVSDDPRASMIANNAGRDDFPAFPLSMGVLALSDNSFGGVVVYDTSIIQNLKLSTMKRKYIKPEPFQSADLELIARNEREIDTRCRTIAKQLRASFANLAEHQAKANADWHDDPSSDDHAKYHAPAIEQFPPDVRNAAIIKVLSYHLRELDIEAEHNASK